MTTHQVKLLNWHLEVTNLKEYHLLRREIFSQNCYYFETSKTNPIIFDIGAHIGLASFYFKRLYPRADIFAFEPQTESFELLNHNLEINRIPDVSTYNLAVMGQAGEHTFYQDASADHWYSASGYESGAWDHTQTSSSYSVQATTLSELVKQFDQTIDLVKLDVEGAEWEVLFSDFGHFASVKQYLVEYHPTKTKNLDQFVTSFPEEFELQVIKNGHRINAKNRHPGLVIVSAIKKA